MLLVDGKPIVNELVYLVGDIAPNTGAEVARSDHSDAAGLPRRHAIPLYITDERADGLVQLDVHSV